MKNGDRVRAAFAAYAMSAAQLERTPSIRGAIEANRKLVDVLALIIEELGETKNG